MVGEVLKNTSEGLALIIGAVGIADEVEEHLLLFEHDLLDTETFAKHTKGHNADEFLGHHGNLAEAVFQSRAIGFKGRIEVMTIGEVVEFAVEQHTFGVVRHVLVREIHLDVGLQGAVIDEK